MTRCFFALTLLVTLATAAQAKGYPGPLLHAAQCLADKGFLPPSTLSARYFGYVIDIHSYPKKKLVYVVEFASRVNRNGWVYSLFMKKTDDREVYNIWNNAKFVLSRNESEGVSFVNPPLGGIWIHEHLEQAILRIEKQARIRVPVEELVALPRSVRCEAYTDSQ